MVHATSQYLAINRVAMHLGRVMQHSNGVATSLELLFILVDDTLSGYDSWTNLDGDMMGYNPKKWLMLMGQIPWQSDILRL